jgi:hypothetical protein
MTPALTPPPDDDEELPEEEEEPDPGYMYEEDDVDVE